MYSEWRGTVKTELYAQIEEHDCVKDSCCDSSVTD